MKGKKLKMYKSGYCAYSPHQHPCLGQFSNGNLATNKVTLCSCECHGDYEARMTAAGQRVVVVEETAEDDEE